MAKKRIAVLYGGKADEHSISCISTAAVLNALDADRFEAIPIGITKRGQWITDGEDPRGFVMDGRNLPTVRAVEGSRPVVLDIGAGYDGFFARDPDGSLVSLGHIDAVFPVLHGPFGEDGTVQGLLEMMGVSYVGCGVFASAACMDKHFTKVLLQAAGIPVAPGVMFDTRDFDAAHAFKPDAAAMVDRVRRAHLPYPVFVKPSRGGSSFGVHKVESEGDGSALAAAVLEASHHDWKVLVEQGIDAREIECAVFAPRAAAGDEEPKASLPGEIVLDHADGDTDAFYDFDSKYVDAHASHAEVPAHLPEETLQRVRDVAVRAFKAVDGAGLSRVDTFVNAAGEVMVNEINTMPGFTPISMYPKAWEAMGVPYGELLTELIEGVL